MRLQGVGLTQFSEQGMEAANQARKRTAARTRNMKDLDGMKTDAYRLMVDNNKIGVQAQPTKRQQSSVAMPQNSSGSPSVPLSTAVPLTTAAPLSIAAPLSTTASLVSAPPSSASAVSLASLPNGISTTSQMMAAQHSSREV